MKTQKLLERYHELVLRLEKINQEIIDLEVDGEDVIPGHDEGGDYHQKIVMYKVVYEQLKAVCEELKLKGLLKIPKKST